MKIQRCDKAKSFHLDNEEVYLLYINLDAYGAQILYKIASYGLARYISLKKVEIS